ncbi:MAG TPA: class I SAM-dependent methyltransferase [Spirochaetota bacterium]|nr:class I SAM-dependent methyltransferase [Spirochaetota bacterium]HOM38327.1 class I SAM-dependent methyltransferase [Spirochaetota bacterium]HPQ48455.1 class I SAM-dependent methyltransferase [Spirochaetota bacterium]
MNTSGQSDRKEKHYIFYKESIKKYSPFSVKALRWNSKESQLVRFRSLLRLGDFQNKSLLDVGCGIADLFFFLKENSFNIKYTGIEILKEFFDTAKIRLNGYENINLINNDFFNHKFTNSYDFTICNGSLNLKEDDNYRLLFDFINKSISITNNAIGVTLLKEADGYIKDERLFHYDQKIVESLLNEMNIKNYKIFSDYADNDFTVLIYL